MLPRSSCKQVSSSFQNKGDVEKYFFTALNVIAEKYSCKIEKIDLENNVINLTGPKENQIKCAVEIEEVLGPYLV